MNTTVALPKPSARMIASSRNPLRQRDADGRIDDREGGDAGKSHEARKNDW